MIVWYNIDIYPVAALIYWKGCYYMKQLRKLAFICAVFFGLTCTFLLLPERVFEKSIAYAADLVDSGTCGKNAVWQLSSDGTFTVSGTGEMYGLYSQFLESWEEEKSDIKTVVIGSGITNVGAQCFSGCPNLTSVTLPDTLTAIHESAFSSCKALTAIAFPDSLTSIGTMSFAMCKKLTDLSIPQSVSSIGSLAFSGTAWLEKEKEKSPFVIINHLLIYGPDTEEAVIPDGVTTVVSNAFYSRSNMTKLTIPDTVTNIEYNAFLECTGLISVTVPDSVTDLGMQAFCKCAALKEVTILNPVCKIYDRANTFANDNETYSGVIKGYDGSTAEAYAAKYGYKFESLGAVPLKGDIDGNGAVELDDAQLALAAYTNQLAHKPSGLSTAQEKAADVTGDGEVTVDDAQAILQFYTETLAGKNPTWDKILHSNQT